MTISGGMEACARCGSISDVRLVKYVRGKQKFRELWCRRCREQKLVPQSDQDQRGHNVTGDVVRVALLILGMAVVGAVVLGIFRLLGP